MKSQTKSQQSYRVLQLEERCMPKPVSFAYIVPEKNYFNRHMRWLHTENCVEDFWCPCVCQVLRPKRFHLSLFTSQTYHSICVNQVPFSDSQSIAALFPVAQPL